MQGAETVCDAQLRVKDRPAFQLISTGCPTGLCQLKARAMTVFTI